MKSLVLLHVVLTMHVNLLIAYYYYYYIINTDSLLQWRRMMLLLLLCPNLSLYAVQIFTAGAPAA